MFEYNVKVGEEYLVREYPCDYWASVVIVEKRLNKKTIRVEVRGMQVPGQEKPMVQKFWISPSRCMVTINKRNQYVSKDIAASIGLNKATKVRMYYQYQEILASFDKALLLRAMNTQDIFAIGMVIWTNWGCNALQHSNLAQLYAMEEVQKRLDKVSGK